MPFRTTINGLLVECDTPGELLALTKKQSVSVPEGTQEKPVKPVRLVRLVGGHRDRRGFVGNGKRLLEALKEAYPTALTTRKLIDRIGVDSLALPAIIMGLRKRASHEKLDFDSLVIKEEISDKGVPMSSYQITDKGIEALQKYGH